MIRKLMFCKHRYQYTQGYFRCIKCGKITYKNRRYRRNKKKQIGIILGALTIGIISFWFYQNMGINTNNVQDVQEKISRQVTNLTKQVSTPLQVIAPQMVNTMNNLSQSIQQNTPEPTPSNQAPIQTTPEPTSPIPTAKPIISISELEQKIHTEINLQRQNQGLKPLIFDTKLADIARGHSQDMATRHYFEHDTPEGVTFSDRYKQAGYTCEKRFNVTQYSYSIMEGGENIFQNNLYNSYETIDGVITNYDWNDMNALASSTVNGWMNSSGHRHNILEPEFDSEGVGVAISSDDKVYITEDFC